MKTSLPDLIKPILALLILVLAFAYFFTVLAIEKKANLIILTAIVGMVSGAIGYYFGASSGSAKKDETIAEIAKNTPPQS